MRTKAIIRLGAFKDNVNAVKKRIGPDRHICFPVKADAYGHGAPEMAKAGMEAGADCLGVSAVTEGAELRKSGIKGTILLFCQPHPQEIPEIFTANLFPFVSDTWFADTLNEQALERKIKLSVHLKIDTGMGRIGCRIEEALALAKHISACAGLELAGTATHFPVSDSTVPDDIEYTKKQISLFTEAVDAVRNAGIDPGIIHAANSGAVILHPDAWFDMVRPGILLYGIKTAEELPNFSYEPIKVQPVMELRTAVVLIKKIKKGETVSYGRTWTAPQDTNIAILSAGYADGFPRLAGNRQAAHAWRVSINGKPYHLVGRICMDQCCVDLGLDSGVNRWDEAVIFGGVVRGAGALAEAAGTIPYEIICNINKRVPRVYEQ